MGELSWVKERVYECEHQAERRGEEMHRHRVTFRMRSDGGVFCLSQWDHGEPGFEEGEREEEFARYMTKPSVYTMTEQEFDEAFEKSLIFHKGKESTEE